MEQKWKEWMWIPATIMGSALFSLGFSLFLQSNEINSGGISGLAMVIVELTGVGSVGVLTVLINLPLFILGAKKLGRRFFFGSLLGMLISSILIDAFALIPFSAPDTMICTLYGGVLCGIGVGIVFAAGTSTGGSDILIRLLKLRYRNVPIGQISMFFDVTVVVLTGIVFRDVSRALYSGLAAFICGQAVDLVVYRFDYSKVALIVTEQYAPIAQAVGDKLERGATYLQAEGSYSHKSTKVVLAVVKKRQLSELKELIMGIDPAAFVIVLEAHQVLGDGFKKYTRNSL